MSLIRCRITEKNGSEPTFVYGLRDFDDMKGSLIRFSRSKFIWSKDYRNRSVGREKWVKAGTTGMFLDSFHRVHYDYWSAHSLFSLNICVELRFLINEEVLTQCIPCDLILDGCPLDEKLWNEAFWTFDKKELVHRKDLNLSSEDKSLLQKPSLVNHKRTSPLVGLHNEIATYLEPLNLELIIEQNLRWWWAGGFKISFPDDPNFAFAFLMRSIGYEIELQRKSDGRWSDHKIYTP